MDGWLKLWRKLGDSELWLAEPFTRGQAWVDLLMLANHTDGYLRKRGIRVEVRRGQVGWSEGKLANIILFTLDERELKIIKTFVNGELVYQSAGE